MPPPPIYVINLDSNADRMTLVAENLQRLQLPYTRVSAVLGKNVPEWEKLVDARLYSTRNRRPMPRHGEVGCYMSHLKTLEVFLRSEAAWCVILEDDVEILPECIDVFKGLGERNDWDLAKLFCFHSGMPVRKRALTPAHHLVVHLTRTTSSAAYAVNRRAAENLLQKMLPISEQVDHALDRPWETGLRIRAVRPFPVVLGPISKTSTIGYKIEADQQSQPIRTDTGSIRLLLYRANKEIRRFTNGIANSLLD